MFYRHYKGGLYEELGRGTREGSTDREEMVLYRNVETGDCWVRPASEFDGVVDVQLRAVKRFKPEAAPKANAG